MIYSSESNSIRLLYWKFEEECFSWQKLSVFVFTNLHVVVSRGMCGVGDDQDEKVLDVIDE